MQRTVSNKLYDLFLSSFEPPFTGSIPQWLNKNVSFPDSSPNPGPFDIGLSPWLKDVYTAIQNPEIEIIILRGASQTFKTGVTETIIPYWIINDPAKVLRIHHTRDVSKHFTKTRLMPMLRSCAPVAALLGKLKDKASTDLIVLPNMEITITGPTENFQHGFSAQRLTIDEAHLIDDPGIFEKLIHRTDQFKGKRKIIISTTPGTETYKSDTLVGDELSLLVDSGRIVRRAWKCPGCGEYNIWHWSSKREDGTYSGIIWGKPVLSSEGKIDVNKTSDNAKLECHYCRKQIDDKPEERIKLEQSAIYLPTKDTGNPKVLTFEWPAWVAPRNSFKDSCLTFFKAKEQSDSRVYGPMQEFIQQVAGESWNNRQVTVKSKLKYISYNSDTEWKDEKFRFLTCDLQGDGRRYWMVIAFDAYGNGRLIAYGCCNSWQELDDIAVKYKVQQADGHNAHFVGVDCGYDWRAVAQESVRHGIDVDTGDGNYERFGWLCLRGEHKDTFQWEDGVKRVVSEQQWYDAGENFPAARVYFWSNKSIKTLVASIRDGHNKLTLSINNNDESLQRHLYSEYPDEKGDWIEKSSINHWWDTLCMAYAMGLLAGIPFLGENAAVKV
jgi:hypothetical protein